MFKPPRQATTGPQPIMQAFGGVLAKALDASNARPACAICGPRQRRELALADGATVKIGVLCEHEEAAANLAAEQRLAADGLRRFRERFGSYMPPKDLAELTLEGIRRPEGTEYMGSALGRDYAEYYLEHWDTLEPGGCGLIFHGRPKPDEGAHDWTNPGGPGTGKTLTASTIAAELLRRGVTVAYFKAKDLGHALHDFDNKPRVIAALKTARLLVLDELVGERETAYLAGEIIGALDARYEAKRPTIITTNFDGKQIARFYQSLLERENAETAQIMVRRLLSRLQPPRYMWIPFDGPDMRVSGRATWGPAR
jgi:hypothetical protein